MDVGELVGDTGDDVAVDSASGNSLGAGSAVEAAGESQADRAMTRIISKGALIPVILRFVIQILRSV